MSLHSFGRTPAHSAALARSVCARRPTSFVRRHSGLFCFCRRRECRRILSDELLHTQPPLPGQCAHVVRHHLSADTQASFAFADAVNVAAFFRTNSCTLSRPCPVSVRTSSDIICPQTR